MQGVSTVHVGPERWVTDRLESTSLSRVVRPGRRVRDRRQVVMRQTFITDGGRADDDLTEPDLGIKATCGTDTDEPLDSEGDEVFKHLGGRRSANAKAVGYPDRWSLNICGQPQGSPGSGIAIGSRESMFGEIPGDQILIGKDRRLRDNHVGVLQESGGQVTWEDDGVVVVLVREVRKSRRQSRLAFSTKLTAVLLVHVCGPQTRWPSPTSVLEAKSHLPTFPQASKCRRKSTSR